MQTACGFLGLAMVCLPIGAAESPFLITYTHQMEEPGSLEVATKSVTANPARKNRFLGGAMELEYGVTAWWTSEFYLDGQFTSGQSSVFTGYRWENRVRLLPREHWINPVLYLEFENINGADRALLEVVGNDGRDDLTVPNAEARAVKKREMEAKLILSSYVNGWTIAENFIAEKNLIHAPFEFGYAVGVSRPLAFSARPDKCNVCPENLQVGVEAYGGLGTHQHFGLRETSHYVAPTVSWTLASGASLKVSPGFGVTGQSADFLLRFGVSYELAQFGRGIGRLFSGRGGGDADAGSSQAGAKLYERNCAACHGREGAGSGKVPALKRPAVQEAPSKALLDILKNGSLRRGMPSFAHLPEPQRLQIVDFLKSWTNP